MIRTFAYGFLEGLVFFGFLGFIGLFLWIATTPAPTKLVASNGYTIASFSHAEECQEFLRGQRHYGRLSCR